MERVNLILNHPMYQECLAKIEAAEKDRLFCRHNMSHFLDVARIAMIFNLEKGLGLNKEWIYAAGLLHDIGRYVQYEDGTPHEEASSRIAPKILEECGFNKKETGVILEAIREHRTKEVAKQGSLSGIIYDADKKSRACFACKMEEECNWKKDKKNKELIY